MNSYSKTKVPERTLKKLDIINGATATKAKESMDYLKHSLQEAGKIEPDKPSTEKYEKRMLKIINKNSYLNCLFNLSMAVFRNNKLEQKFFIEQSSTYQQMRN